MEGTELGDVAVLESVAVVGEDHILEGNAPAGFRLSVIKGWRLMNVVVPVMPGGAADNACDEFRSVDVHGWLAIA